MTKNNEKTTDAETASSLAPNTKKSTAKPNIAGTLRHYLVKLAIITAPLAFIGVMFLMNQLSAINNTLNQDIEITNNNVSNLVEQQKNLQRFLTKQQKLVQQYQKKQARRQTMLEARLEEKLKEQGYQSEDWQLHKAQYLLELVQINTHWQQQATTSIALLQQADRVLKPFNNHQIFEVRQTIAKEIEALKNTLTPDSIGLLSQLDALKSKVQALPHNKAFVAQAQSAKRDASENKKNNYTWKERWSNSVNLLEKLVVIRYHHQNNQMIIPPEQQSLIKASVRLSLQQAQWAVMQHDQNLFEQALKDASRQLSQLSSQQFDGMAILITQFKDLARSSVVTHQPATNTALQQLNAYLKSSPSEQPQAKASTLNRKEAP